jgi:hypothetical protein
MLIVRISYAENGVKRFVIFTLIDWVDAADAEKEVKTSDRESAALTLQLTVTPSVSTTHVGGFDARKVE